MEGWYPMDKMSPGDGDALQEDQEEALLDIPLEGHDTTRQSTDGHEVIHKSFSESLDDTYCYEPETWAEKVERLSLGYRSNLDDVRRLTDAPFRETLFDRDINMDSDGDPR